MSSSRRDLLLACRWPAALMFSSLVLAAAIGGLAWTAVRLLSRPIPIAIEGGLQVDRLVLPPTVTIDVAAPLPVRVSDAVSVSGDVRAEARVSGIDSPVSVAPITVTPITVAPVSVDGAVTVKETVRIDGKVKVDGPVNARVGPRPLQKL